VREETDLQMQDSRAVEWDDKGTPTSPLIRKCWGSFLTPTYELCEPLLRLEKRLACTACGELTARAYGRW